MFRKVGSFSPFGRAPYPGLRGETWLGQSLPLGPSLAFRDGETEARRCLNHCPVQAYHSHAGGRQPENTGDPTFPLDTSTRRPLSKPPRAISVAHACPSLAPGQGEGAGRRPSFQEAHLLGAREEGSLQGRAVS